MQPQILPSRAALVDRIALQFEYGQNLITLVGPSGLGKSYLLETFITDKYNDFNKALVQLNAKMTDQELMGQLLEQSFSAPLIDHDQNLSENFYRLANEQDCGACLWVLDGGRHISDEMAQQLEILATKSPATLYILVASNTTWQFKSAVEIHLEPLSIKESKQLMAWYFKALPIDEDPVYQTFLNEARGNPNLLLAWDSGEQSAKVVVNDKVSWRIHLIALMLLIMLLIIGFVYKADMTELWQEYYQDEPANNIETALPTEVITQKPAKLFSDKNAQQANSATQSAAVQGMDETTTAALVEPHKNNVAAILASLEAKKNNTQSTPLEVVNSLALIDKTANVDELPLNDAPANNLPISRLPVDNAWYLEQQNTRWVIQLLAVKKLAVTKQFISANDIAVDAKTYQTQRSKQDWWIVTYGNYATLNEAKAALATLSDKVRKNKPFYKKIDKIKQEITALDR